MLRCADGSYYVGSARYSLDRRMAEHRCGELGGYTSKRRPVELVWSMDFQFATDAIAFERQLKGWSRAKKEALIRGDYAAISKFARRRSSSFETAAARPPQDEAQCTTPQPEGASSHRKEAVSKSPKRQLTDRRMITLILARADNGVIGSGGGLPWHLPDDLRRFKALTLGKPVVMGRKTWESLPKKPLPGRDNIVVTRARDYAAEGARVASSLDEALAANAEEIMVIGGAEIFAQALPRAGRIHLTELHLAPPGDVRLPPPDPAEWREIAREEHQAPQGFSYSYVTFERIPR
jgi:dihydrofolate reductase